jgi:hypothetical protein
MRLRHFLLKNANRFTKTGSGQTWGNHSKQEWLRFLRDDLDDEEDEAIPEELTGAEVAFFEPCMYTKRSIYQDRLGTNMMRKPKNADNRGVCLPQGGK